MRHPLHRLRPESGRYRFKISVFGEIMAFLVVTVVIFGFLWHDRASAARSSGAPEARAGGYPSRTTNGRIISWSSCERMWQCQM